MNSPLHHLKHPEGLFEHFHKHIHHAFVIFTLAIIGMLRGVSHILTPTSASRQWGGFITSDFRDQNPSQANIMYALFGDGTPGDTAYTRLRTGSCVPTNVQLFPSNFSGGSLAADTIYILSSGNYILTSPIVMNGDCSALIGTTGNVILKPANNTITPIIINPRNNIIIDNVKINGNGSYTGIYLNTTINSLINNVDISNTLGGGLVGYGSTIANISNSRIYNNNVGISIVGININNSLIYNNTRGIVALDLFMNNSQVYNNDKGIGGIPELLYGTINNSIFYNNNLGLYVYNSILNNTYFYNNLTGLNIAPSGYSTGYGLLKFFNNTEDINGGTIVPDSNPPITSRAAGQLDTGSTSLNYDRYTNPQNGSGQYLLSGTNRSSLRGIQPGFNQNIQPIRYIFGGNILKQIPPITFDTSTYNIIEYGSDGADYKTPKYITEPDSILPATQQALVNQYFGSGSIYTQNWQTNGCSLSAFQIVYLNPGNYPTYNFQDHTIYILTGGEYTSTVSTPSAYGFAFDGNCIALIGNNNTRFTKSGGAGLASMLYAYNKRNIIIDGIKIDGLYYSIGYATTTPAQIGIKFNGTSNNTTINNVQVYNNAQDGIYLGLGSHHNTIINTQAFNNTIAGIYLYYSSNYNVINNTQTYNNGTYGIWFANGSNRNTMNNFQAYNNTVGVFGDLTTQENILNRAAIYNNSDAGIYFKNSSGNSLNDVRIYNNTLGIRTWYSSPGNKYYGDLKFFGNLSGDFDGTNGNDGYLLPGTAGLFPYAGTLSTGTTLASCLYATNPTLSGTTSTLLSGDCTNTGYIPAFQSSDNMYINYAFGLNMYKQKIPVRYESGNVQPVQIPSQYDANKYIAEVFAIRDTTPENVYFASSGAAQLNIWYTTNVYTAGVLNVAVPVIVSFDPITTSGYLSISGHTVGLTGIVNNGDILQIHVLTRTGYNETIIGSITLGTVTTGFTVTTRPFNQTPTTGSFAFDNLTNIPQNIFTGSTTTIDGLETGVYASITFSPVTTSGRLEIYSGTTFVSSGTTGLLVYNGNQVNVLGQSSSGYSQVITGYITIGQGTGAFTLTTRGSDTLAPTIPVLTYPLSGEEMFFVTFNRIASIDTGSGLERYAYEIAEDSNFADIITTGFITATTGTLGSPTTEFDTTNGHYYWRMKAKDMNSNYSDRSTTGYFNVVDFTDRNFNDKIDANLNTYYNSNEITLEGIRTGLSIWAMVSGSGTIYKNGTNKGTGTFVQNGDNLFIHLKSSDSYNDITSSTLTIANRALEFNVTTSDVGGNGCTLSSNDENTIQTIYTSLVQNYSGDQNRFNDFLNTMQSMLADQIDFTNDCNLQYLQNLISSNIGGITTSGAIDTGTWIAPNCKEYPVSFDSARNAYTSPSFRLITFFANRDSLDRYIDSKNPGDCHINIYGASSWYFGNTDPSRHIAPNGKVYLIQSNSQGYTSSDFSVAKYFPTLATLSSYIDSKNLPFAIRSHQVDTTFTPQTYTAPNSKVYTIYKTNRGYMSYELINIRYFASLSDIQSFISRNNPR